MFMMLIVSSACIDPFPNQGFLEIFRKKLKTQMAINIVAKLKQKK